MSDAGSPPEGEKDPDKKRHYRQLAGLVLKAAVAAGFRYLFEKLWP
ncbi:hypothetical protein [Streptomyces longwoodensis]